jgi:hypothetical protein
LATPKVNRACPTIIEQSFSWNILDQIRIDHKSYLILIVRNGVKRQHVQDRFEFEFKCLQLLMHYGDGNTLKADDYDFKLFNYSSVGLKTMR